MATTDDFLPGDPARHVLGREEEKPARRHAPLPPPPERPVTASTIAKDVRARLEELRPLVAECKRLEEADAALEKALAPFAKR